MGQFVGNQDDGTGEGTPPPEEPPAPTTAEAMAADLAAMTADPAEGTNTLPPSDGAPEGGGSDGNSEPSPSTDDIIQIGDLQIPVDQTDAVVSILNWASNLTEEQAAAAFAAAQNPQGAAAATAPEPPEEPPAAAIPDELAETYPEIAEAMRAQQAEIAAMKEALSKVESTATDLAFNDAATSLQQAEDKVRTEFMEQHNLTDEEYMQVIATARDLGVTRALVEQRGIEEGFRQTLDLAFKANPDMQARAIAQLAASQQASQRKANAASLTPQGGSAPRTQPDPANLPVSEKRKALVQEIQQLTGLN